MKRILGLIALTTALAFNGVAFAQDKKPDAAPAPAAAAPADAKAAPAAPAAAPATAPAAADAKAGDAKPADAAAAPAAPAAPDHPVLIGVDKINSGDTAWMLTSMALVLMMTVPGLALFYGGMVRKKNVLADSDAELRDHVPRHGPLGHRGLQHRVHAGRAVLREHGSTIPRTGCSSRRRPARSW